MSELWSSMQRGLFDGVRAAADRVILSGFPLSAVLSQLHDAVVDRRDLGDLDKALICEKLAEVRALFLMFTLSNSNP
jgi:hypothetical protein